MLAVSSEYFGYCVVGIADVAADDLVQGLGEKVVVESVLGYD